MPWWGWLASVGVAVWILIGLIVVLCDYRVRSRARQPFRDYLEPWHRQN